MGAGLRGWRRLGLRARLTLVSTVGLAVALAGTALALRAALHASEVRGLNATARQGAAEVAALAGAHRLPDPVPVAAGTLTLQVLNARGVIVDASPGADRLVPLLAPGRAAAAAADGTAVLMDGRPYGIPYPLWVVAVPAGDHQTVIAAVDYGQVADSAETLTRALLLGTPLLALLLAGAIWLVVGSALRPIAALRRGAQEVTRTGRPRALPVPAARDEVASLAVTLNDMLARLAAAQQRQRALVSDTAHELRSPLASIRTQLEVALDHPGSQDWRQTAGDVLADTLRLARLAEDLLVLARLDENGLRPPTGRAVDLAGLVRAEVARRDEGRVPVVAATITPCLATVDGDGLRRALANLIDNAERYARTAVRVSLSHEGGHALLTVTDDGPGIAPEDAERAFDRFARLDEARSRDADAGDSAGAGLGLAIVRATARAHGGDAWLEGAPGSGLRAVIRVPVRPAADHSPPGRPPRTGAGPGGSGGGQ